MPGAFDSRFFAVRNRVMPPESASPGAGKVAPVHATTNRTSGRWHTNGQQCQSNVYWHAANVGVKPKQLLTVPTEGALSGRCPSCQALAEQASAPLAAHPSVAARPHETQENILDILNTSTSFPYNGHRFRVGVDDGRTCDCGHIADSLLDRWRHLYAVGALITAANN